MKENKKSLLNKVKSCSNSKISIAIVFTLVGIIATLAFYNLTSYSLASEKSHDFARWNDDDFFISDFDQAFQEMNAMHRRMDQIFAAHRKAMKNAFNEVNQVKSEKNNQVKISQKEDEDSYYYELYFTGFDKDEIIVGIKDNSLNFAAKSDKRISEKNSKSYNSSNFSYFFLLPDDAKTDDPQIVRKSDKVIVQLAKK